MIRLRWDWDTGPVVCDCPQPDPRPGWGDCHRLVLAEGVAFLAARRESQ